MMISSVSKYASAAACKLRLLSATLLSTTQLPRLGLLVFALTLMLHHRAAYAGLPELRGQPGAGIAVVENGTDMIIDQQTNNAVLDWNSFDIGANNSVTFDQPNSSSAILNRIFDTKPSLIQGSINANGHVYLYNQNGMIFDGSSRINVGSLTTTTLSVDPARFMDGTLLSTINSGSPAFFDASGNNTGEIDIRTGAKITTHSPDGGRIFVIASKITNAGTLTSPDGQTILSAAKDKVYLVGSDGDPGMRGLLVEVNAGGTVDNLGNIIAERGNISLVGMAVNQMGHVRATTSIDKNGSIRLLARDTVSFIENGGSLTAEQLAAVGIDGGATNRPSASKLAVTQRSGEVVLGKGSSTVVALDSDSIDDSTTAAPDARVQLKSKVEVVANKVWMQKNSQIIAPSGEVKITATDSPAAPMTNSVRNDSYVYLDEASQIDVSGTTDTVLAMERNSLAVDTRSNELADAPLQRESVLRGETLFVDLRKGADIIDYSGALANVEKGLQERLSSGGNITIRSEGDVVQHDGSVLNVSGGQVQYTSGYVKESKLVSEGRVYSLNDADIFRTYDAVLGTASKFHQRWGVTEYFDNFSNVDKGQYVYGFVEGKDAGRVSIEAASALLADGGVRAGTVIGPYQRDFQNLPNGGELDVNLRSVNDIAQNVHFLAESFVTPITDQLAQAPGVDMNRSNINADLVLSDKYIANADIAVLRMTTNGEVVVDKSAAVVADLATSIDLTASKINVDGSLISHSGSVALTATPVRIGRADLNIGADAVIDTSGIWINDSWYVREPPSTTPLAIAGGSIRLQADGYVNLNQGSVLDVSGGAWLNPTSKVNAGKGGDIGLVANVPGGVSSGSAVKMNGDFRGYGLYKGGKLNITTASVLITDDTSVIAAPDQMLLRSDFFNTGGFGKYVLTANTGSMTIDAGLQPRAANAVLNTSNVDTVGANDNRPGKNVLFAPSETPMQALSHIARLPESLRQPVDLEFNLQQTVTNPANLLVVTERAAISTDVGASLHLNSDSSIHMLGSIDAPAGEIALSIKAPDPDVTEPGFMANQGIWLANGSRLSAKSDFVKAPNERGLNIGTVFDAGSVTLAADRGYVVIQNGATIDVSAKSVALDRLAAVSEYGVDYQTQNVAPKAGAVKLASAEGIFIEGDVAAHAARLPGARGGSLEVALSTTTRGIDVSENANLTNKFNFNARDIILTDQRTKRLALDLQVGATIGNGLNGAAYLSADQIETSGFDKLRLNTSNVTSGNVANASEIRLESDFNLALKNSVYLNAPRINANGYQIDVSAPYLNIGTASASRNTAVTNPQLNAGGFTLNASLIDVLGDVNITNTGLLRLNALDDIRLTGATSSQAFDQLLGSLNTAANIEMTARQVYPSTNSKFEINLLSNPDGVVSIAGAGEHASVLSAGGHIGINAPTIKQGGVIKAPLGEIVLNATDSIQLLPDSLLSISTEGAIIPFGKTQFAGSNWNYNIGNTVAAAQLPEKSIELNAPNIDLQNGSVVAVSGGGDAVAWEFVSGPGGSKDVLLGGTSGRSVETGAFAVLPDTGNMYAPYDSLISNSFSRVGETIYLDGGNGLAAGYYAILPATYALLPGAKLVTPVSGIKNIFPGRMLTRADGTAIVPGQYAIANTDSRDSTWNAFVVEDGGVARTRSEYVETYASDYFPTYSPANAGSLIIDSTLSLMLAGSITGDHIAGAQGSRVDIISDNIEVTTVGAASNAGFIQLTDAALGNLNVDSIMLGGRRTETDDGETSVAVQSSQVVVRKNASLQTPELLLVAKDDIALESGAALAGAGGVTSTTGKSLTLDNNASIVSVSVNPLANLKRTGSGAGRVTLAAGSTVSGHSVMIDGTDNVSLDGDIVLNNGSLHLGARQINLGTMPVSVTGLNLTEQFLASLSLDEIRLRSQQALSIYDDVNLSFNNMELTSSGINSISTTAADFTSTGNITLRQNGSKVSTTGSGAGVLTLSANQIRLINSDENFVIDGFDSVNFTALQDFTGGGDVSGWYDFTTANVQLDTPLIKGDAGSYLGLRSTGNIDLVNTSTISAQAAGVMTLAAEIDIEAARVNLDTQMVFPSGRIAARSTGTNENVITGNAALLDVSGRTLTYVDSSQAGSSGGQVDLISDQGSVITSSDSRILLASSAVAGDAGRLNVTAGNGSFEHAGSISTSNAAGYAGASFRLDINAVADLPALLQSIQDASFTAQQSYRIRNGDITLLDFADGSANITAHEIGLAADNGKVNLSGYLDASGADAGKIAVYASGDVNLNDAVIDTSTGVSDKGGEVILGSSNGVIVIDNLSQIDVSAAEQAETGRLVLRAPRTNTNSDIAISDLAGVVTGAEHIDIVGVASYGDNVIGTVQTTAYRNDAEAWILNKGVVISRLGLNSDPRVRYLAGVDVINAADITVSNPIDFYQWQQDTRDVIDVGALTIRAGNHLNINASISDAVSVEQLYTEFSGFPFPGPVVPVVKPGDSWNYQLVAGADIASVNPMAVLNGSGATTVALKLASGVAVRTGNASIDIASSGDLNLVDQNSVIYTTGEPVTGKYDNALLDLSSMPDGPLFGRNGGDISINTGGNIIAGVSNQFFSDWLQRIGSPVGVNGAPGMWGVVLGDFEQGIATFGGGDITVRATGDIVNLSVSTPRTGLLKSDNTVLIQGGGNIDVVAGGNYRSAKILADGGRANLRVDGDMNASISGLNTLLAVGDAQVRIETGGEINIEGIANTTMLPITSLQFRDAAAYRRERNYFFTYGDNSTVDLQANAGKLTLNNDRTAIKDAFVNSVPSIDVNDFLGWGLYPGSLSARTLTADLQINNSFTLFPDADGQLALLSAGNIRSIDRKNSANPIIVTMSDVAVSDLPGIYNPANATTDIVTRLFSNSSDETLRHSASGPIHQNDSQPVRFVANNNILIADPLKLVTPKRAEIHAGGDIINLDASIQNLQQNDKSQFIAGGDILYTISTTDSGSSIIRNGIHVTGPGAIDMIAGGNIDLGQSLVGIRASGNDLNPSLPATGADISVYAGISSALDAAAFISTYLEASPDDSAVIGIAVEKYQSDLIKYIVSDRYQGGFAEAVSAVTGSAYSSKSAAVIAFNQLNSGQQLDIALASFKAGTIEQQRPMLLGVLFNELDVAARERASTDEDSAYARGFQAINHLFGNNDASLSPASGDIKLPFSRIVANAGGDINLLAPNGGLTVGFTAAVEDATTDSGVLGVVVGGKGDLSALTNNSISVNLSRMLTLDGGNILLWSSTGDIDAGRGAKTALTVSEAKTIFVNTLPKEIPTPNASGSGIGAAAFTPGTRQGSVVLAAPGGVIDASDAGIRSEGDIVLAATRVLGGDNISAGGAAIGVPVATNVTAGLSGLSSASDSAINNASDLVAAAADGDAGNQDVALVTVEYLGAGE